jgi:tetratricopeptide (TPR) repeat protein
MIGAYAGANKSEALAKLYRQMIDQFSDASWSGRAYYGLALHLLEDKRYGAAATLLEKAVKLARAGGDSDYYCDALHRLYNYYNFGGPIVIRRSREYRERRDDPDFKKATDQKKAEFARSEIVGPMGLAVHSLRQDWISGGHLAPYQLLILVRSGTIPFAPGDVLAMRNYVATGGSLLVIVSPGWEHAQPGIHNPLLSFFDVRADHRMVVRAHSTQVKEHPITVGIEKALCPTLIARLM